MSNSTVYNDRIYPVCLIQDLAEMQREGTLCDVTLVASAKEILAHKAILAAASPYFRALFLTGMKEAIEGRIEMHDMDFSTLKSIIEFLYTTEIEISEENVYPLLAGSDLLQIFGLRAICNNYLKSTLSTTNCLSVYVLAGPRGYRDLAYAAYRHAVRHFSAVMQEEEFLQIPAEVLAKLLKSQLLDVPQEGDLLQGVMKWLRYDPSRVVHLESLIDKIHLSHIPVEILLSVKIEPLVADTILVPLIDKTINEILAQRYDRVDKKILWNSQNLQPKLDMRHSCEQAVLFALGGRTLDAVWSSVECFTLGYDSWKCMVPKTVPTMNAEHETRVIPIISTPRFGFAVTHTDYEMYVIGGRNNEGITDLVECYNIQTNEWRRLAPLPVAVVGATAAIVERQLIVVGGENDNKTERRTWIYDDNQDKWKEVASMNKCRAYHGVASVGGCLYAVGGIGGSRDHKKTLLCCMERYNPHLDQWHFMLPMRDPRVKFGCIAVNEFIYVIGGTSLVHCLKSVERYNSLLNEWDRKNPMGAPRYDFALAVSNGCIYCLGGNDSQHYLNTVEKYNTLTDRWHYMHSMQVVRIQGGAATLYVPQVKRDNS